MLTGRRHGGIGLGRDKYIHIGVFRPRTVLPVIVGTLQPRQRVREMVIAEHQGAFLVEAMEVRQAVQRDVELAGRSANLEVLCLADYILGQVFFIHHIEKGTFGIKVGYHDIGVQLGAVLERHTIGLAMLDHDLVDVGIADNVTTKALQGFGQGTGNRTHATTSKSPGTHITIHVTHIVVQQYIRGSWRVNTQRCTDNPGASQVRFNHIGFEILVKKVTHALGPELQGVDETGLAKTHERPAIFHQVFEVAKLERRGIRRCFQQERTNKPGLLHDIGGVALVGIGIALGMPGHLPVLALVVIEIAVVVAILHEGHTTAIGHHLQAMPWQFEVAHQFRAQQAAHVGAIGISPPLVQLTTDRCPADIIVSFQHRHVQPGLGQVGGVGEAIVASTYHDRIILLHGNIRAMAPSLLRLETLRRMP